MRVLDALLRDVSGPEDSVMVLRKAVISICCRFGAEHFDSGNFDRRHSETVVRLMRSFCSLY